MAPLTPKDFIRSMNKDTVRVHAPTPVVFLCGGVIDGALAKPVMLRDAFHRLAGPSNSRTYDIVLAESAKDPLSAEAGYQDLLKFESDIAQIVGIILLFVESAGSLAELGAFAAIPTIAPSLLAVVTDHHYQASSFVRNGPIRHLEISYADESVFVLDDQLLNITPAGDISGLKFDEFMETLSSAIDTRLQKRSRWATFDKAHEGHIILLIVGLCQEIGALTALEIIENVRAFGVDLAQPRLHNFLYCAILLGWIVKVRKGHHIFFAGVPTGNALDYEINATRSFRDRLRWRADIRSHWKEHDSTRLRVIGEVAAASTGGAL